MLYPPALDLSFFTFFCISPLVLQKYTPPNFISSSLFEFLGNKRFFTGGLFIKDGLGFQFACFEDSDCFGSNSRTKVYAEAYKYRWLEWLKLFKDGLHHFLLVVLPRISP